MKETFFFSHDYNARTDTKIKKLLAKHGMQGYGIFWSIIEDLYNNANALQLDIECIAYDLRASDSLVKSVLFDFDLFSISDTTISSESVESRLARRNEKSIKASESAKLRWKKKSEDANDMRSHSDSDAIKESKVKDSKVKEINIPFDLFWSAYRKKTGKVEAEKKWIKLSDQERELIMIDLPLYQAGILDVQFQKMAPAYLNQKLWLDGRIGTKGMDIKVEKTEVDIERENRFKQYENRIRSSPHLTGKRSEYGEQLSKYHAKIGFYDELRPENI